MNGAYKVKQNGSNENGESELGLNLNGGSEKIIAMKELPDEIFEGEEEDHLNGLEEERCETITNGEPDGVANERDPLQCDTPSETTTITETQENGIKDEEEEDIPLILFVNKPEEDSQAKESQQDAEEIVSNAAPSPLAPIRPRLRPALRGGSPLNSSFSVRSEPSSPDVSTFPRLRKAQGHLSLLSPRKRGLEDIEPESSSDSKRPCTGWLGNITRWWKAENTESEPAKSESKDDLPEPSPRSCNIM